MARNPFIETKAEGFNHSYDRLALLMEFKLGVADVLLSNSNVFITGSRGSGKSMYLRLLSHPVKASYERLALRGEVEPLPDHTDYLGVYVKLSPLVFGPSEHEKLPQFRELFQQLFNIYCSEAIVQTILESTAAGVFGITESAERSLAKELSGLMLQGGLPSETLRGLYQSLRNERRIIRGYLDNPPFKPDGRSQPDVLWDVAEAVSRISSFSGMRLHLMIDEYDSLSPDEQRTINTYLRKRDYPLTFKIACKKHKLILEDADGLPLNPSGDFDRVHLDDEDFGFDSNFPSHLEAIANKRLRSQGIKTDIKTLLGRTPKRIKSSSPRRYAGWTAVTMLSSGIVRTFLELCRDIYANCEFHNGNEPNPVPAMVQDRVIHKHASDRWTVLSRDQSARPELQHLVAQVALLFAEKSQAESENQIIRLEIIDFESGSNFLRSLLGQTLEYEAFVKPNRERLQKNRQTASQGYLLHRLLCVHFNLDLSSRWDVEVSAYQLERMVLGPTAVVSDVARNPTFRGARPALTDASRPKLPEPLYCPILDSTCPHVAATPGLGFLACRLPKDGKIRDAIKYIKESFSEMTYENNERYEIKTAEDYPPAGDIACKVCDAMSQSDFVLVELSGLSPSVAMELGLAVARGLRTYLLFNDDEEPDPPEPFNSIEYTHYSINQASIESLVQKKLHPWISSKTGDSGIVKIGTSTEKTRESASGVFIALPGTDYYQKTLLPLLREQIEKLGLGVVRTEQDGLALHDLVRAADAIAASEFCLIDITHLSPTRSLYLGMAQGFRKRFASLVDMEENPESKSFTNARLKSTLEYRGSDELLQKVTEFFGRFGVGK